MRHVIMWFLKKKEGWRRRLNHNPGSSTLQQEQQQEEEEPSFDLPTIATTNMVASDNDDPEQQQQQQQEHGGGTRMQADNNNTSNITTLTRIMDAENKISDNTMASNNESGRSGNEMSISSSPPSKSAKDNPVVVPLSNPNASPPPALTEGVVAPRTAETEEGRYRYRLLRQ